MVSYHKSKHERRGVGESGEAKKFFCCCGLCIVFVVGFFLVVSLVFWGCFLVLLLFTSLLTLVCFLVLGRVWQGWEEERKDCEVDGIAAVHDVELPKSQ